MRNKKLYITPSLEEVSIEVNNIIATSIIYPGEEETIKELHPEIDVDLDDREEEDYAR